MRCEIIPALSVQLLKQFFQRHVGILDLPRRLIGALYHLAFHRREKERTIANIEQLQTISFLQRVFFEKAGGNGNSSIIANNNSCHRHTCFLAYVCTCFLVYLFPCVPAHLPAKRLQPRLRPAQNQRVDVVRPFVGIDRFEVHDVADDVKFI